MTLGIVYGLNLLCFLNNDQQVGYHHALNRTPTDGLWMGPSGIIKSGSLSHMTSLPHEIFTLAVVNVSKVVEGFATSR